MSDPVRLSENTMHFWYLFHARDDRIKPVEKVRESYGVNRVERIEASSPTRGVNRNYQDYQSPRVIAKRRAEYKNRNIPKPEPVELVKISEPWLGNEVNEFA